ncbi:MAG: hypothetical protein ABIQ41_12070 [Gemmatimonadales bacterium]
MFVGHTALALAAKRRAPEVSLGWLFAAAITLDLVWPVLLLLGIEQVAIGSATGGFDQLTFLSYPWSHSLLMALVWGGVVFALARWRGISKSSAIWLGALVVSHWVLDYASHAPDLPLWPGNSPRLGLGLWSSIPGTLIIEGALYLAGITLYVTATKAKDRVGSIGLWAFLIFSAVMWVATPFSAPPPSVTALAWFALVGEWAFVAWAWWADAHREVRQ